MVFPGESWKIKTPESEGIDSGKLEQALKYLKEHSDVYGLEEAVLIRNGYLIWSGDRIDRQHRVWSVSKTFTSTVLGILCDLGICSIDTTVARFIPELLTWYPEVTFRHLVTMTSGYKAAEASCSSSKTPLEWQKPDHKPGEVYFYNNDGMHLLACALTCAAGEPIRKIFQRYVADRIGITDWQWGTLGEFGGRTVHGGTDNLGCGISITAKDLARFGHLFLNGGCWKESQVLSSFWVNQATAVQVSPALKNLPYKQDNEFTGSGVYGFNWWVNGCKASRQRLMPDAPPKTFFASGAHHNKCYVVPEWNLVFVRMGTGDSLKKGHEVYNRFFDKLKKAVHE